MNRNIRYLFDSIKDGLLIVSPGGEVQFANLAARAIFPVTVGKQLQGEWLRSQLMAIERGYLKAPLSFDITVPGQADAVDRMQITLLSSPIGKDFVVLMKNLTAEQLYENVINNLAEMLDCELNRPMQQFLDAATQMLDQFKVAAKDDWPLRESVAEVNRRAEVLEGRLKQIALLASAFKASPIHGDDRIVVSELIVDAVSTVKALLMQRHIRLSYAGLLDGLPVIYGSKTFLIQAVAGYLRHLVEHIAPGANILISARAKGNFMLLGITNFGRSAPPNGSTRLFLPLLGNGAATKTDGLGLTLPLCKRVVELNGGHLRLEKEGNEVSRIVLELPIGAPAVDTRDLGLKQAERYAQDLLTLMQRGETAQKAPK
jgi:signal transduction histidine kinase